MLISLPAMMIFWQTVNIFQANISGFTVIFSLLENNRGHGRREPGGLYSRRYRVRQHLSPRPVAHCDSTQAKERTQSRGRPQVILKCWELCSLAIRPPAISLVTDEANSSRTSSFQTRTSVVFSVYNGACHCVM